MVENEREDNKIRGTLQEFKQLDRNSKTHDYVPELNDTDF